VDRCPLLLLRVDATLNATTLPIVVSETGWPGVPWAMEDERWIRWGRTDTPVMKQEFAPSLMI